MPAWLTARSEGIDLAADGEVVSASLSGQRTQAYLLVDHLRWPERECRPLGSVTPRDLERYGPGGADVRMSLGEPWRRQ